MFPQVFLIAIAAGIHSVAAVPISVSDESATRAWDPVFTEFPSVSTTSHGSDRMTILPIFPSPPVVGCDEPCDTLRTQTPSASPDWHWTIPHAPIFTGVTTVAEPTAANTASDVKWIPTISRGGPEHSKPITFDLQSTSHVTHTQSIRPSKTTTTTDMTITVPTVTFPSPPILGHITASV